jgi:hypothetical protein
MQPRSRLRRSPSEIAAEVAKDGEERRRIVTVRRECGHETQCEQHFAEFVAKDPCPECTAARGL